MANTLRFKRGLVAGIPTAALGEPLFTTDTFDLYIGNGTTNTRFQKYIASGATTQILRGDGSLYTFPLAISSPSNGQVLKYNGTSWVNDSDAGITGSGAAGQVAYFTGATTQAGSNSLFWDNTNLRLGIGVAAPSSVLDIAGATPILNIQTNVSTALFGLELKSGSTLEAFIKQQPNTGELRFSNGRNSAWGGFMTFYTDTTEKMRLRANGNLLLGTATDSGQRLQVIGTGYFSDSVGIGTTSLTPALLNIVGSGTQDRAVSIAKTFTGGATRYGILQFNTVNSDVNGTVMNNYSQFVTQAATFTLTNAYHFYNADISVGAGSTITNQYVYFASPIANATNNYGFYGNIGAGTNRWNLYMNGTANNYMAGSLGIGSTSLTGQNLVVSKNITGASITYNVVSAGEIRSDVTIAHMYLSQPSTQATTFTLSQLYHFRATQGTIGTNSTITNQYGFAVQNTLIGAATNIGFFSDLAAATGRWNFYANGTALNYLNGSLLIGSTTDSGEKLQVTGTMKITGATSLGSTLTMSSGFIFYLGTSRIFDSGGSLVFGTTSNPMIFQGNDGGARQFYFNNTVLIGSSTSSGENLQVTGTAKFTSDISLISSANAVLTIDALSTNTAAFIFKRSGTEAGRIAFSNSANMIFHTGSAATQRMVIDGSTGAVSVVNNFAVDTNTLFVDATNNRVGIGTLLPNGKLSIIGSLGEFRVLDSGAELYFTRNGNNDILANGGTSADLTIGANNNLIFKAGSGLTERMRITSGGNVLVGTTTDSGYKLRVNGTSYYDDNARFPNNKGVIFVQTGGSLLGSISMDTGNRVTIDNNGFSGVSVATDHTFLGGNFSVGHSGAVFGGGTRAMSMLNGTAPSSSFADAFLMYSNDVTAGNAAPHIRTENGAVIKLYQETTSVGNSIFLQGGGNSVLDDSTFDGYTLRQIVKALRNQGILA